MLLSVLLAILGARAAPLGRVLSFSTVVRKYQVEITRNHHLGADESAKHTVDACQDFRDAVSKGWPGAKITWAFSWQALVSSEANYVDIRERVASFVQLHGDEMSFVPSGYFAPMYNSPNQTNADIHDAIRLISSAVGNGYRPRAIIGGYLSSTTLRYLSEVEHIHVAQGTIFSQYAIDYGDGDGTHGDARSSHTARTARTARTACTACTATRVRPLCY